MKTAEFVVCMLILQLLVLVSATRVISCGGYPSSPESVMSGYAEEMFKGGREFWERASRYTLSPEGPGYASAPTLAVQAVGFLDGAGKAYPNSPEKVVEAFVQSDFDGSANEVIGDVRKRMQYVSWVGFSGDDCSRIARQYQVIKRTQKDAVATVSVQFEVIGDLCGFDSYKAEKKELTVLYGLVKGGPHWKVDYPDTAPIISPLTALRMVEFELSRPYLQRPKDRRTQLLRDRISTTAVKLKALCRKTGR